MLIPPGTLRQSMSPLPLLLLSARSRKPIPKNDIRTMCIASRSARYLLILMLINIGIPIAELSQGVVYILDSKFRSLFILAVSWPVICMTSVIEDIILNRFNINVKDKLQARKIYTQLYTMRRILAVVIMIVAVALILMGFDSFRQFGTSILASAGIAGLIIGLAA